jgi:DNA-3-methyladenine glycosylase
MGIKKPIFLKDGTILKRDFFEQDTLLVADQLLGKILVREFQNIRLAGIITETEAYIGEEDLACHAHVGKTKRNSIMYGPAGNAYVYFTYGMHWCLNCVTGEKGFPAAVLIRSILPTEGLELIKSNRSFRPDAELCNGPAKICQAFAITGEMNGSNLCNPANPLMVIEGISIPKAKILRSPRVGIQNVPEPWRSKPWRFRVADIKALI